jgi:NAD(P)-dependent dehydrogenase (short-subunit alcohol dehydrogenase family)
METQVLKGWVALVTGGTTGIGFGAAECLIREGAIVYITGRRQDVLDNAVAQLGQSARGIAADASNKADMLKVADAIRSDQMLPLLSHPVANIYTTRVSENKGGQNKSQLR